MRTGVVGNVVGVHGPRVKVELAEDVRSAVRAGPDGARVVIAINSYLTFEMGAGETALGVVTDLESRERWDPAEGDLTLELVNRLARMTCCVRSQQINPATSRFRL